MAVARPAALVVIAGGPRDGLAYDSGAELSKYCPISSAADLRISPRGSRRRVASPQLDGPRFRHRRLYGRKESCESHHALAPVCGRTRDATMLLGMQSAPLDSARLRGKCARLWTPRVSGIGVSPHGLRAAQWVSALSTDR
ncbi:hypothetical protein NDU88_004000 [Pleurodeles waltl]|uniref:Uncharacterized protein n=1 Tax=Pleurodeles waltl TaxID=8319 RepID=A0AAV7TQ70_PLEWA|nr:hypothetical protein NDU88_004000 [Pleurodeles waltl]